MSQDNLSVRLSRQEMDYLTSATFLSSGQLDAIRNAQRSDDASVSLTISRKVAEDFRDAFTSQLAKAGFDERYEVTAEGRILEDLIDRFFKV